MTVNEILDLLSSAECELFILRGNNPKDKELEDAWRASRTALETFYKNAKDRGLL